MTGVLETLSRHFAFWRLVVVQTIQRNIVSIKNSWLLSAATQPDAWKRIAHRSDLYSSRIFRPKLKNLSQVPLVIMVHGGGFIMNNPAADDPLPRYLADNADCIVTSIDYRKAPRHAFPAAYEDIVAAILALLDDNDLPIDKSKVTLCGSSAGGNLVLGAAQDPRLRGKIYGLMAIYPIASMTPSNEEQMARRPDPSIPDFLGDQWDDLLAIYAGTTDSEALQDPRLSPTYFQMRDNLPKHVYMTGCEHDLLCHEAKMMAQKLVSASELQKVKDTDDWQAENVRWRLFKGHTHAFDRFKARTPDLEEKRLRDKESMYRDLAQWLRELFSRDD